MRDDVAPPMDDPTKVTRLLEALDAAAHVVRELRSDPLLRRVIEAVELMPAEDRPVVVEVLEREVQARRLSKATEAVTGQVMHPNVNARLYVRAHESAPPRAMLERDELMLAMLNAFRVTPILQQSPIHEEWIDATRKALEHVDATVRGVIAALMREVLALVEQAAASGASRESADG